MNIKMDQWVKWDGEKIVKGPQGVPGDDTWVRLVEDTDKPLEAPCSYRLHNGYVIEDYSDYTEPYYEKRSYGYPSIGEQLDLLFHDIENGTLDQTGDFYNYLKRVKDMHPKPEETDGD